MRKRKVVTLLLICAISIGMVGCSSKANEESVEKLDDEKVLRVGVACAHKPWCYKDGDEIKGLDVDVLQEVAKRMGDYKLEFEVASFDGMFGLLDAGKVDTVAQQISITPEREKKYKFSEIYAYNPYKLSVREEDESIKTINDLKGKTFVCQPSGFELEYIKDYKEKNDPNDEIKLLITEEGSALSVDQEKADSHAYPVLVHKQMIKEGGFKLKMVGNPLYEEHNAYPFLKNGDEELYSDFNHALNSMREDGFMTNLFDEYFGVDISESKLEK